MYEAEIAELDAVLGYPRKGVDVGDGWHAPISDTPGEGWTLTATRVAATGKLTLTDEIRALDTRTLGASLRAALADAAIDAAATLVEEEIAP